MELRIRIEKLDSPDQVLSVLTEFVNSTIIIIIISFNFIIIYIILQHQIMHGSA